MVRRLRIEYQVRSAMSRRVEKEKGGRLDFLREMKDGAIGEEV